MKIKVLFMLVVGFLYFNMSVSADDFTTVNLVPIHIGGTSNGPHRTPSNILCPILLEYDEDSNSLLFSSDFDDTFTYYIYDNNEDLLFQGVLVFSTNDTILVDLTNYDEDYFIIQVEVDGTIYEGVLE